MDPEITAFCTAMAVVGFSMTAIASLIWLLAKRLAGYEFEAMIIGAALSAPIGGVGLGLLSGYWIYHRVLTAITG